MRIISLVIALALLPAVAVAEPQTVEQRIGMQIGALVIQNAQLQTRVEQLEAEIVKLGEERKKAIKPEIPPEESEKR